ncbi:hypothetical protein K9N68_25190 [Kovacikia minuta CCNUW1]|uniref:hypothetical protein n=1 Tax=Kovacikia minuta TaxID=2931930 RepID=UPI001CCC50EA|nr:hypothetical protein [Kovacikia minuta]UBF24919.1 hypothetical protein K9N68_25190 [Kovacikia minuta CCNUW1]
MSAQPLGDILNQATAPLSTDAVMAALYDGLPTAEYDRAKHSLANTLSVGRSKGLWKSAGRGVQAEGFMLLRQRLQPEQRG